RDRTGAGLQRGRGPRPDLPGAHHFARSPARLVGNKVIDMNRIRILNPLQHTRPECHRVIRLLPMLPDGELSAAETAFVEAHLAGGEACRREAQAFLGLGELLRQETAPEADLPAGAQAAAWILGQGDGATGSLPAGAKATAGRGCDGATGRRG